MAKRTKKDKPRRRTESIDGRASNDQAMGYGNAMPRRRFFRDVMLGLIVCVVFSVALEAGLRIAGISKEYNQEDPYVGFSGLQSLFVVTDGKASTAIPKLKYFNQVSFTARKKPGTLRIFCFGGSTTYGHPFDGRTAFPRWLGELLAASSPGKEFDVINAGGIWTLHIGSCRSSKRHWGSGRTSLSSTRAKMNFSNGAPIHGSWIRAGLS